MEAEEREPDGHDQEQEYEQEEEHEQDEFEEAYDHFSPPRGLPADLPRTLDDRQNFSSYNQETEYYDAWQGRCFPRP